MLHLRLGGAVATRLCTVAPPPAVATAAATTTTAWLQLWQQPEQQQQHPSCSSARIHTTCATAAPRRLVKGSVLPKRGRKIIGEGKHRRSGTAWLQGSGSRASSGEEGLGFVRSYKARNSRPRRVAMAAMPRPKGETDVDESFVNHGYYNWVKQRSEWQGDSNEPKKRYVQPASSKQHTSTRRGGAHLI